MGTVISNETTSFYFHISIVRFVSPCLSHRGRTHVSYTGIPTTRIAHRYNRFDYRPFVFCFFLVF